MDNALQSRRRMPAERLSVQEACLELVCVVFYFVLFFPLIGSIVLNHSVSSNFNLRPVCSQDKRTGFLYRVAPGIHPSAIFSVIIVVIDKLIWLEFYPFVSVPVQLLMACAIPSFLTCSHEDAHSISFWKLIKHFLNRHIQPCIM